MTEKKHQSTFCCQHSGGNDQACVSLVPIFNHLENDQLNEIMQTVKSVRFNKGEFIYTADDEVDSLYIVSEGKIKIFHLSESGKELLVRVLQPGDFTGELALFQDSIHKGFAQTVIDTQVCVIKRSILQELLLKYPSISLKILAEFASRLEKSEKQTIRYATEKVETRIALYLAECMHITPASNEIKLPVSYKDLASYLGTTPESISRTLTRFEEQGFIKKEKQHVLEILDLDGLLLV